jgi:hypothetical protein
MTLHMEESINCAVAVCNNAVSGPPQNPLQTGEINTPRVRDN